MRSCWNRQLNENVLRKLALGYTRYGGVPRTLLQNSGDISSFQGEKKFPRTKALNKHQSQIPRIHIPDCGGEADRATVEVRRLGICHMILPQLTCGCRRTRLYSRLARSLRHRVHPPKGKEILHYASLKRSNLKLEDPEYLEIVFKRSWDIGTRCNARITVNAGDDPTVKHRVLIERID